ncbi:uncharacterized protein LOC122363596 [Amphibalanus amphitrite]|uniref:uncharacterized protein LOC122363596 n=1 Tax=Amphibalanus amphitrite TaxID=1232801 RepID=UPI001C8FEBFE|nr:uncharacterized protein LOC122363596 [Amphibalanus amphitrite]
MPNVKPSLKPDAISSRNLPSASSLSRPGDDTRGGRLEQRKERVVVKQLLEQGPGQMEISGSDSSFAIQPTRRLPSSTSNGRPPTSRRWASRLCHPPLLLTRTTVRTQKRPGHPILDRGPLNSASTARRSRSWPAMWHSNAGRSAATSANRPRLLWRQRPYRAAGWRQSAAAASTSPASGGWAWWKISTTRSVT